MSRQPALKGPGHRYLIQHSAGSGKTNSISWLTHRLSVLHDDTNKPVFDSVIVITDRNVLDAQLQEAIRQIDRTPGVVAHIAGLGGAKSQELADALQGGTKIIIVTIQTFPYALELIRTQADLKGKNFADHRRRGPLIAGRGSLQAAESGPDGHGA